MKKIINIFLSVLIILSSFTMLGCDFLGDLTGGSDNVHTQSFDAVSGKFYLYESADKRVEYTDTYFDIDGSKENFSLKYYENGILKREGKIQRIVAYSEKIGYLSDNLHFNVKCGEIYEHISTYTESLEPINQFRIIDEYCDGKTEYKYYYSELPFVLGTYVREGASYVKESINLNDIDYTKPTLENYTAELNGKYQLDEGHYFYFINPNGYAIKNGAYLSSYFQYYSPQLDKPIEGFVFGTTYKESILPPHLSFTYSRKTTYYSALEDTENALTFGYITFKSDFTMIEHYGSIDFNDGRLNSFTFEHLSRNWTESEWDKFTKDESYMLPDAIIYDYVGGTYYKV